MLRPQHQSNISDKSVWLVVIAGAILVAVVYILTGDSHAKDYNRYACQAVGYQDDCTTPLAK